MVADPLPPGQFRQAVGRVGTRVRTPSRPPGHHPARHGEQCCEPQEGFQRQLVQRQEPPRRCRPQGHGHAAGPPGAWLTSAESPSDTVRSRNSLCLQHAAVGHHCRRQDHDRDQNAHDRAGAGERSPMYPATVAESERRQLHVAAVERQQCHQARVCITPRMMVPGTMDRPGGPDLAQRGIGGGHTNGDQEQQPRGRGMARRGTRGAVSVLGVPATNPGDQDEANRRSGSRSRW